MKYLFQQLIRGYQKWISPLKKNKTCRFYPTCSTYAAQALDQHGFIKALAMIVWRLLRCHPFHPGGVDMVSKSQTQKVNQL